jgi:hypothetical protein
MIVLPGAGVPVYPPALKDKSAMMAFYAELERWISSGSPAREKDAVLDSELVSRILKDMSSLVGNISGLGPEMCLWPEPFPQAIEFYHPRTASRTGASTASVANRGTGLLVAFRPRKVLLHSGGVVFEAGIRALIDERESAPGLHNSLVNESSPELYTAPQRRDRVQEATDAIVLVPGNRQAETHRVNSDEG